MFYNFEFSRIFKPFYSRKSMMLVMGVGWGGGNISNKQNFTVKRRLHALLFNFHYKLKYVRQVPEIVYTIVKRFQRDLNDFSPEKTIFVLEEITPLYYFQLTQ